MTAHLGLILHVTTNHFSPYGFFSNPNNGASSTWWVSDSGSLEEYVNPDLRAWAQADGNSTYDSIETSGTPDQPLTAAQVETVAGVYAWGHKTYGWPFKLADTPGETGLGWHGMGGQAWGGHFGCPGDPRKAQRQEILNRAQQLAAGTVTRPVAAHKDRTLGLHDPLMRGEDVRGVQHALNVAGNHLAEDGIYGRSTADLVQKFKDNRGIKEAGVGPLTWEALRDVVHGD